MIRLNFSAVPVWIDIAAGVRLRCRPPGTSVLVAAGLDLGEERGRLPWVRAVARSAILDWEGVVDEDDQPVEVSPEAVDALMENWPAFSAFERKYVTPAMLINSEGNA